MKKAFTLVEMLVVIGIIAVLTAATIGGYSKITATAEKTKCRELVSNVAIAMTTYFQRNGAWPSILVKNGKTDGELDENVAYALKDYISLNADTNAQKLKGLDKFGIVTPWATEVIKRRGSSAAVTDKVPSGGSIKDHILHYAIDLDGDGIIENASVGGEGVSVRATAIVWCCGKDGIIEAYTRGLRKDDIHSWTKGQTQDVK